MSRRPQQPIVAATADPIPVPDVPPVAPTVTPPPPDAIRAALAIVSEAIQAEAREQWTRGADGTGKERAAHARMSLVLSSIAARIQAATP